MYWPKSHPERLTLSKSRYPGRLKAVSLLLVCPAILAMSVPLWGQALTFLLVLIAVRYWRLPVVRQLQWQGDGTLRVTGKRAQQIAPPYRVWRLGPWFALATPHGWLHLFADQASNERLQPFYQWLWVNRR